MSKQLSWQKTVTTAGTALAGPDTGPGTFLVRADPDNTGEMYLGNDGSDDVTVDNGFTLGKDINQIVITISNMNKVYFDAANNGDKVQILKIGGENSGITPPAG